MKWLIKKIGDEWAVQCKTETSYRPRGNYRIVEGPETKYPKVVEVKGVLKIKVDQDAKQNHLDLKAVAKAEKEKALAIKKAVKTLKTDVENASTIEDIKVILGKITRVLPYVLRELND